MSLTDDDMRQLRTACDMQGLSQEFAALVADLAAEKDETFRLQTSHSKLYGDVQELRAESDALRAALLRYGGHGQDCMARTGDYPCECGFDAASAAQEPRT